MNIHIVPDEACPGCGAYWGNPDKSLDFPNRIKVDNDWKCYNPACEVGYYRDGEIVEMKPSPERMEEIKRETEEWIKNITFGKEWKETSPNTWELVPKEDA